MKKGFNKKLLGRDPTHGKVSFRTGDILTRKDKLKNRKSKWAKNFLRKQIGIK